MYQTVTNYDFHDAFRDAGREDQFTYEALDVLFEYYEQWEQGLGEQIELDVAGICSLWSEYSSIEEAVEDLGRSEASIYDRYTVLEVPNGNILVGE